jgi:hypothetical protein
MIAREALSRTVLLCRDYVIDELSEEDICQVFESVHVLCVADRRNLSSRSGQAAFMTLVSLLSRMGMQIGLRVADVPLLLPEPLMQGVGITDALIASSGNLMPGATVHCDSPFTPDLVFVLGDTSIGRENVSYWRLSGSDWLGSLALVETADGWSSDWTVGAMVSAALAANEAFKFVMRRLPMRNEAASIFLEASPCCQFTFGAAALPAGGIDLGRVDLVSAGAISQAALYALLNLPNVRMAGRIFDDDVTSVSNLNRNMLTLASDVGIAKVLTVAERCGAKLRFEPVADRFLGNGVDRDRLASRVLVGVDDIPSRWIVQRHAPNWVGVSGTSHFSISSSAHEVGEPCCGCLHPVDDAGRADPIPTISFISFWAGLGMAVRLVREALRNPYPRNRQHLWMTPLRMDHPHAAMWLPVAPRRDCPVRCSASQRLREDAE